MKDFYTRFRDYFEHISDSLNSDTGASSIFPNSTDSGGSREDLIRDFLISHLPKKSEVFKGGFLFDMNGNESKQIDLLVANDITLQFKKFVNPQTSGKSFNYIGGCLAAFSIKSNLDKKELEDSLLNIASIPMFPYTRADFNPLVNISDGIEMRMPLKVIFAFKGLSISTILKHIDAFYKVNNHLKLWQMLL
jgi:hypothetical protein